MIVVHHLNNSRSQRILWLLEELGLDYEVRKYQRDPKTMLAPPELRAIHPLGKSPVITDDGIVVAESGAIIEYLTGRHGAGRLVPPAGSADRLRYTFILHYAEGSAMPPLLMKLVFDRVESSAPFIVRPVARAIARKVKSSYIMPQIAQNLAFLEAELGRSAWFAGNEFTAADIQISFIIEAAASRGGLDGSYPNLGAYLKRIHERPAYRRAIERGGPFTIGK